MLNNLASLIVDKNIQYPTGDNFFSPDEAYPEYRLSHISSQPNLVYRAVRDCLAQVGLDAEHFGLPEWNPFKDYMRQGDKVFLLCNFVYHRRAKESKEEFYAKCTHASVIRALIDYVLIAVKQEGQIDFGNAPLQSCMWEQVLNDTGGNIIIDFYKRHNISVTAKDLRQFIAIRGVLGQIQATTEIHNTLGTLVKLDDQSLLDELYVNNTKVQFRVSDYNPDSTEKYHGLHQHEYIINNEILSSDVILSVPKLKTHEKVGITVGLKGLVGCVAHKDCLAHHRFGSNKMNGDEYPENGRLQILRSSFHDFVYRRSYPECFNSVFEIMDKSLGRTLRKFFNKIQAGAWYGNDTAWRMTLDLAYIVHFADAHGQLSDKPQRKHLVFIDGVIGGEGNGPLSPTPAESRCLVFSNNIILGDAIACRLMGYDSKRIPLIHRATFYNQLIGMSTLTDVYCILNGNQIALDNIPPALNRAFVPPKGWQGYLL